MKIRAAETGGSRGRTMRVSADGTVTVHEAGGKPMVLVGARPGRAQGGQSRSRVRSNDERDPQP